MAALEMVFDWRPDGCGDVRFTGLTGSERVTSLKQAVDLLEVENPAVTFCRNAEAGLYDSLPDADYRKVMAFVEAISALWRYEDGYEPAEEAARREMNVMMLLANAIELIGRQAADAGRRHDPEIVGNAGDAKP